MTNEASASTGTALQQSHISKWVKLGYFLPGLVLAFCLGITYLLWSTSLQNTRKEEHDYFNFRAREVVENTAQRLHTYEQVLRGAQGLFRASSVVQRKEFKNYVATLRLSENFPGIQGVGYAIAIPPDRKAQHVASMRRQGFSEYTIKPAGERKLYTSIIYLEPFTERNLRAFGYDMYSDPVRREAMDRARDTGLAAMSGKVLLVQEAGQHIQAGFLIYLPVYRNGLPHATLAERRANLIGWIYAPFRTADLVHGIYGERAIDLDIHIYDGEHPDAQSMMFDSSQYEHKGVAAHSNYVASRRLKVAGHTWTIQITARPGFESRINTTRPYLIAGSGILTSLLLAILVWMLVHGRARAIRLAQHMNRELIASEQALQKSESKLQTLLDNTAVGIAWADKEGRIAYANHAFTEMFGYTLADVPTVEAWYLRAYPDADYRNGVISKWNANIGDARKYGSAITPIEVAVTCKDGSVCYVIITAALVGTDLLVSLSDITERKRNEKQLQQWAQIFEHAEWGITVGSADGKRIEMANPAFARQRGYTQDEILHLPIPELFAPEERKTLPEQIRIAHEKGHHTFESVHLRKDGSTFPVLVDVTAIYDERGNVMYRAVNVQDISKIKASEKALQDSRAILQTTLDNSPYLIWLKDASGRFVAINQAFLHSTGREHMDDVLGKTDAELWPRHLAHKYQMDDTSVIASGHQHMMEEQALSNGRLVWMETFKTPVFDTDGKLLGITGFARDITERKRVEEKVRHQAYYDQLTELPNRVLFSDRLAQAMSQARRGKSRLAVLFLDLDRFKPVNDLFGHDVGDVLLHQVAQRILECVRESDTVARIGGDEFCILLHDVANDMDASTVADKILHALRAPFMVDGNSLNIASSIGIAIYPEHGRDEATLVKNADIAMYQAKENGRDAYAVFDENMLDDEEEPA